jgi:HSP20 family protein
MFSRFPAFDRPHAPFDELRRQMFRMLDELDTAAPAAPDGFPQLSLADAGASLVLEADLPGMTEKDVDIQLTGDVLTLKAERRVSAPEGYTVHRNERAPARLARSIALPCKVDPERTSATLTDGVLTLTLAKAAEAQPRKISIKATLQARFDTRQEVRHGPAQDKRQRRDEGSPRGPFATGAGACRAAERCAEADRGARGGHLRGQG